MPTTRSRVGVAVYQKEVNFQKITFFKSSSLEIMYVDKVNFSEMFSKEDFPIFQV